eukprot:m.82484 g.82484  ORF g.82484 m.82484 type:complete len:325 (+) comp12873_c0_seq1:190-1164(+)
MATAPCMEGAVLFAYKMKPTMCAVLMKPSQPTEIKDSLLLFVPGLTDGLLCPAYTCKLAKELNKVGISFCQPILSSSYLGFGTSSLDNDVSELDEVFSCSMLSSYKHIIIAGHSTGCQDAVHYLKHGRSDLVEKVKGIILQAPASDRESMVMEVENDGNTTQFHTAVELATSMCKEGNGQQLLPRDTPCVFKTPITAERYLSFAGKMGPDDKFSSDLSDEELLQQVGHIADTNARALLVFSGADEYVPPAISSNFDDLGKKLCSAMCGELATKRVSSYYKYEKDKELKKSNYSIITDGSHALDSPQGVSDTFVTLALDFTLKLQ